MAAPTLDGAPRSARWFLFAEGVLLIALGAAAMAFPILAGIATAVLFGWILIAAGAVGLFGAFTSRPRVHFWWSLFSAALAIIAGLVAAFLPLAGAVTLVVVIAVWLALDGVASLMIGLDLRRGRSRSWGWSIVSGLVDWALAAALLFLGPVGDVVVVGIIVGVDLIIGGAALLLLGAAARSQA